MEHTGEAVAQWGRFEAAFRARGNVLPETELVAEFTSPDGQTLPRPGFWDGGRTWRVRFMPNQAGRWRYRTRSAPADPGLDGVGGAFECVRRDTDDALLRHGPVGVARDGHRLAHADGTPFFFLADTAWAGPLLSRPEDWDAYLEDRRRKRFTAVQFVTHAPFVAAYTNAEGEVAFGQYAPLPVNPHFFRRIDARIDALNAKGLVAVAALLWAAPWGQGGKCNVGWTAPEELLVRMARYQVARYGAHHAIWILAGDGKYEGDVADRWKRIGRAVFPAGERRAPVFMHPCGSHLPYDVFRDEPWLDLVGYQSGHGNSAAIERWIHSGPVSEEWTKRPARPVINIEAPYEGHNSFNAARPLTADDVRRATYFSLLNAPPAGVTYGAHGVWSWEEEPALPLHHPGSGVARPWREAIGLPGSRQMAHAAGLFTSVRWWTLRPDRGAVVVTQPFGNDPARHVSAASSEAGDLAVLYLPAGGGVTISASAALKARRARWFDPRNGTWADGGSTGSARTYRSPDDRDWVLVLDEAGRD